MLKKAVEKAKARLLEMLVEDVLLILAIHRFLKNIPKTLRVWRKRARGRAELARIAQDPRLLADLPVDPADVIREINKPFWQE